MRQNGIFNHLKRAGATVYGWGGLFLHKKNYNN